MEVYIEEQILTEVGDIRDAHIGCGWYNLELKLSDGATIEIKGLKQVPGCFLGKPIVYTKP
jgi:hypothetical protein